MAELPRRACAELIGTAFLLAVVVGSGIMAERLAGGNVAIALLANALATGAGLVAIILMLGPVSGAHLNPVVTLSEAVRRALSWRDVPLYLVAQVAGAVLGVLIAHAMFGLPLLGLSQHARSGPSQLVGELVATFGLIALVTSCARNRQSISTTAFAVGAYITSAYWFTSSTSFANPAVTVARALTDTLAGIRPIDVPAFVVAQLVGALLAVVVARWLFAPMKEELR